MGVIKCGKCGSILSESPETSPAARKPCHRCGSTARAFSETIECTAEIHSSFSYQVRDAGKSRPVIEGLGGDSFYRKLKRWMRLERVIDRRNDHYKEVVTDPQSGDEIHRCEEPLSRHKGHGDDKKNRPPQPQ